MECIRCKKELKGRQTKYCSTECKYKNYRNDFLPKHIRFSTLLSNLTIDKQIKGYREFYKGFIDCNIIGLDNLNWNISSKGYIVSSKYLIPLHQIVIKLNNIEIPKNHCIDHINRNKLDNRLENLRIVTVKENTLNKESIKNKKASKYKGIHKTTSGKYQVQVFKDGKNICFGSFESEIEAAKVYNEKAKKLHGKYAYLNKL